MKRTVKMKWIKMIPLLLLAFIASLNVLAHKKPVDSLHHTTSRYDSLVAEGAAKLTALIKANNAYEAAGQTDKLQYMVRVGFDDNPSPFDSTLFQRNASGAQGYFEPGNQLFIIISDSLRKWNTENTVKSYMLYVNGLFFGLDKTIKVDNLKTFFEQPDEKFTLSTVSLKEAHADITKAIFTKVATTDAMRRTTVLFSIGSYQTNALFKVRLSTNNTPTDSTWVQQHLLLTSHPHAKDLAETDDRKKLIRLVHNAMIYEKPAFTNSRDAINDERKVIGGALKRVQKHKQILTSTTPNQLDDIFKDFLQSDYMALTLPERVHALKVIAGGAMGNNMYNSREAYAVMMVQYTPDEQQKGLLDAMIVEKAAGSSNVLLKDLVSKIDNGHFINSSNDLDEFITSLAKFIYRKMPPRSTFSFDTALVQRKAIGIRPGFWFGDAVTQKISSTGIVELENTDRLVKLNLPAYDYVYIVFNGTFTLGDKTYRKNERAIVPAIIAQLIFNNHNSSKIKAGMKTVFDIALLLTGVGEIRLAMEAKNAWTVAKALWNIGWGVSDFFVNGVLAEKLGETESGRKFLLWYNRVQLVAGGMGLAVSIYDIRQGIKNSRKEFEDDLVDNKLKREMEYGNSEVPVTASEKDDILDNLAKEEDNAAATLNSATNKENLLAGNGKFVSVELESDYQKYVSRKMAQSKTPRNREDWHEAREYWLFNSPMARGNAFNKKAVDEQWYDVNELNLQNGKRLDSYVPPSNTHGGEIISRKATNLDEIELSTFENYLQEMRNKYASGTVIRSNKYPALDGQQLQGKQILEIPVSNQSSDRIQEYVNLAKNKYSIEIRFKPE
jgi:hypothetical protein